MHIVTYPHKLCTFTKNKLMNLFVAGLPYDLDDAELEEIFEKFAAKSSPIALVGFQMISEGKELGEIVEVFEQPHQVLCKIIWKGKEAFIPLHDETLEKVDQKKRSVYVKLPDGLLEIYS